MSTTEIKLDTSEVCLKQALMYLYQEEQTKNRENALPMAYNKAISITNSIYEALGDNHLVRNDIDKIKAINVIISQLLEINDPQVKYLAKGLASTISELLK